MNPNVVIHPSKQSLIQQGHPWIFSKAVLRQDSSCRTGMLVNVVSNAGDLLAVGVYNEHSLYRVRILARTVEDFNQDSLAAIILHRLQQAIQLRQRLNLPNAHTTAFRLVNSEADGLSGLTIDKFDTLCVVSSSAFWVQANQAVILECLKTLLPDTEILWMAQKKPLLQDGWEQDTEVSYDKQMIVKEQDLLFKIDFSTAQKTGLFLDQRENHQRVAAVAKGARVLDLYTYTGGFALHAAKAGAEYVLGIDSSGPAIARAQENAQLNQCTQLEFIKADARSYLHRAEEFDIVVLDPPKLMPSKKNQVQAKNYYRFLHKEVFKVMRPNTLLMTCNCSSALSAHAFLELVYLQALSVKKSFRVIGSYGPASCHPTLPVFPEGSYLTAVMGVVV
ncbi:MAG: class I SAM-dependent rRNA methyltransferase [Legionellaceae bacterium]|nr:class I SAM-dependent rRNA methyltransferase [Legionellaceae bacterium]